MAEPAWLTQARSEGRITEGRPASAALSAPDHRKVATDCDGLRFDLPIPPATNNLYVNTRRGRVLSPEARAWKEAVLMELALKKMRPWVASIAKPFGIEYTVVGPVNMSRDIANFEKIATDVLVEAGVIPGDSLRAGLWKMCLMYVHAAEGLPHVKVEIHPV